MRKNNYNLDGEYKKYKSIGKKSGFKNYLEWKSHVIERYKYINSNDLKCMAKYLRNNKRWHKQIQQSVCTIRVPIVTAITAMLIAYIAIIYSMSTHIDLFISEVNKANEEIKEEEVKEDIDKKGELYKLMGENFQKRMDLSIDTQKLVYYASFIAVSMLLVLFVFLPISDKYISKNIYFCDDYIEIIEEMINTKNKRDS